MGQGRPLLHANGHVQRRMSILFFFLTSKAILVKRITQTNKTVKKKKSKEKCNNTNKTRNQWKLTVLNNKEIAGMLSTKSRIGFLVQLLRSDSEQWRSSRGRVQSSRFGWFVFTFQNISDGFSASTKTLGKKNPRCNGSTCQLPVITFCCSVYKICL